MQKERSKRENAARLGAFCENTQRHRPLFSGLTSMLASNAKKLTLITGGSGRKGEEGDWFCELLDPKSRMTTYRKRRYKISCIPVRKQEAARGVLCQQEKLEIRISGERSKGKKKNERLGPFNPSWEAGGEIKSQHSKRGRGGRKENRGSQK